jgi:3-oxoacyl-[acyl-carrier protein] reductase
VAKPTPLSYTTPSDVKDGARSERVALVTGGAGDIGSSIAVRLAQDGVRVILADHRDPRATVSAIEGAGGSATGVLFDVRDPVAVATSIGSIREEQGALDIVVNAHGVGGPLAPLHEHSDAQWEALLGVNLTGVFNVCRSALPAMLDGGGGRIVNIASVAGKEGNPNSAAYSASKAGVIGLTKALAREVASQGVLVNCVTPGVIDTAMVQASDTELVEYVVSRTPMGRLGLPAEVAEMVAWLCSSACSFSTGAVFDISGGRASY